MNYSCYDLTLALDLRNSSLKDKIYYKEWDGNGHIERRECRPSISKEELEQILHDVVEGAGTSTIKDIKADCKKILAAVKKLDKTASKDDKKLAAFKQKQLGKISKSMNDGGIQ